ncbi:MAG: hypothetical protein HQK69_03660 [Desulfamplus sp.]|nr:hypothetical protein [Desulfamplus sp.]
MKKFNIIMLNIVSLNKNFVSIILMSLTFGTILLLPSYNWAATCIDSKISDYSYLLSFHAHTPENSQPQNHKIYLAGSNDGLSWTLIDNFEPISGSVPELVYYNNAIYIFHTGQKHVAKLNDCLEVIEENSVSLSSSTDSGGYVDPSLIVSEQDLYLFYLPGIIGQDPASCSSFPCVKAIHSAIANNSNLTSFTQSPGDRVNVTLNSGGMSDPEIVKRADGTYLLYLSSGSNVWLFTSSALNGEYVSPDGAKNRVISNNSGGVPGAIALDNNDVWLYVSKNINGKEVIRRAVITNGVEPADDADFITVIDNTISPDFSDTTSVSSPSIIKSPYNDDSSNETELCSAGDATQPSPLANHQVYRAYSNDAYSFTAENRLLLAPASVPDGFIGVDGKFWFYFVNGEPGHHGIFAAKESDTGVFEIVDCVKIDGKFNGNAVDPDVVKLTDGRYRLFFFEGNFVSPPTPGQGSGHPIYSAISDNGLDYTLEQKVIEVEGVTDPSVVQLPDGTWLMALAQGTTNKVLLAKSTNGYEFTLTGVEFSAGGIPELGVMPDGTVRIYMSKSFISKDKGNTWTQESDRFIPGADPSLVKMPDNSYVMLYKKIDNGLNSYVTLTDSSAPFQIPSGGYVEVKGSTGGNIVKIAPNSNVIFKNENAPNIIVFQQEAAKFIVYKSGNTVYLASSDNTTLSIEAKDVAQTIYFTDGSLSVFMNGERILFGVGENEQEITEASSAIDNIDVTKIFIAPIINVQPKNITDYLILTDKSPIFPVPYGAYTKIFGSSGKNTIYVESGGKATCDNFAGSNEISIQSSISDCSVYRFGATLYLTGKNGTYIRVQATLTPQTLRFSDAKFSLAIVDNKVMLGKQEITKTSMPIIK